MANSKGTPNFQTNQSYVWDIEKHTLYMGNIMQYHVIHILLFYINIFKITLVLTPCFCEANSAKMWGFSVASPAGHGRHWCYKMIYGIYIHITYIILMCMGNEPLTNIIHIYIYIWISFFSKNICVYYRFHMNQ